MKRIDIVENTLLEALTDPEITIDRDYAERLLKEYVEEKAGQVDVISALIRAKEMIEGEWGSCPEWLMSALKKAGV